MQREQDQRQTVLLLSYRKLQQEDIDANDNKETDNATYHKETDNATYHKETDSETYHNETDNATYHKETDHRNRRTDRETNEIDNQENNENDIQKTNNRDDRRGDNDWSRGIEDGNDIGARDDRSGSDHQQRVTESRKCDLFVILLCNICVYILFFIT